jgi:transposase
MASSRGSRSARGRTDKERAFKPIPLRWAVERTFAWMGRYRRNSRDYERLTKSSEAVLKISALHMMARRLCRRKDAHKFHYRKPTEKPAA